jgi:hypothetical protein
MSKMIPVGVTFAAAICVTAAVFSQSATNNALDSSAPYVQYAIDPEHDAA